MDWSYWPVMPGVDCVFKDAGDGADPPFTAEEERKVLRKSVLLVNSPYGREAEHIVLV